jgi:hypothetical protein
MIATSALYHMGYDPHSLLRQEEADRNPWPFLQVHLIGLDIFTGKRYEDVCPASHNMNVPNVKRQEYQVCNSKSARF